MPSEIKCPSCGTLFNADKQIEIDIEQRLRKDFQQLQKASEETLEQERNRLAAERVDFEQKKRKENELFAARIQAEKSKLEKDLRDQIHKSVCGDFENQIRLAQEGLQDAQEKLKTARQREFEFLQKEKALKDKEDAMEIELQTRLMKERQDMQQKLQEQELVKGRLKDEEHDRKIKELEIKLEQQKKTAEEMQRRLEQGSMQLQGEAQELLLEEILRKTFVFDNITEVGKGVRGADCIQFVHNNLGAEVGSIIYESKRTKEFKEDWIEKLKTDMRSHGADVAILVTQALPKDMEKFGERQGVYICTYSEVRSVALLLRNSILKVHEARKSQENKGDKMVMLYDYLTGNEFTDQWQAIREGFMAMRNSIVKERAEMEKLWKARERQLEKVLLNASHIRGSISGIAGSDAVNLNLIDDDDALLLD